MKKGTLYIVSTPIGNLEDITVRALRILREVSLIAAEDTRRTRKLLNAYNIETPLTSLHEHNEDQKSSTIISHINSGKDVAYVSDAGTPGISDPGYILTRKSIAEGIDIVPIPGPSAVITALSASGLPMDQFVFHGFLPPRTGKKKQTIELFCNEERTVVFYESPQRLMATLRTIREFAGNRYIVIARELTKIYEEFIRGTLDEVITTLQERTIKGELTIILAGAEKITVPENEEDIILLRFQELKENKNLSHRDIVNIIASETNIPKKKVYKEILDLLEKQR